MINFFKTTTGSIIALESDHKLDNNEIEKLQWLFSGASLLNTGSLDGKFIGPRKEMITPWSTNAVEITQNMGLSGISRIEEYFPVKTKNPTFDKMLQRLYDGIGENIFEVDKKPDDIIHISDIEAYNDEEGLALSPEEIDYLKSLSKKLGRPLTDSEVFGFSQVNSEHCRHKIFNGVFIIDGEEKPSSLFKLIKKTSQTNPNKLVSAYKDNVAFVEGPVIKQFAPKNPHQPDYFEVKDIETVLSLKAETHNFPTTVEPFNGAATGTGGEIRDRLGGGKASLPLAGTAVYMTSYPRTESGRPWEASAPAPRKWLYQTPEEILIKASNGASDFGNKFGQPLICGSVLTFEHKEKDEEFAYDKVIMLAGGVGFAAKRDAIKGVPEPHENVVLMGGDNYRIGMGGGAVSSVNTGQYANAIELNAVQRANPEMQKRVSNVIRALAESDSNPIVSIHDHGAGGHLNALSELVEATGGKIEIDALPIGDPTLSSKEIIGNESQERMGMVVKKEDIDRVRTIAERERAPFYVIGETTGDHRFVFEQKDGIRPIDLAMTDMFGSSPKTYMTDTTRRRLLAPVKYKTSKLNDYIEEVLRLEAVACKDWLTNKVDRSVTGKIARQQCQGEIQLPLSDCGVVALDYTGTKGIATSIGHAPQIAIADAAQGSIASIAEALTNIAGAPLTDGLKSVSLSANWMWPCRNEGEDAALYRAVEACSDFACALGINIPTGKDSLSMTQKCQSAGHSHYFRCRRSERREKSGRSCGTEQKRHFAALRGFQQFSVGAWRFCFRPIAKQHRCRRAAHRFRRILCKRVQRRAATCRQRHGSCPPRCLGRRLDHDIAGNDFCQRQRRVDHRPEWLCRQRHRENPICRKQRHRHANRRQGHAKSIRRARQLRHPPLVHRQAARRTGVAPHPPRQGLPAVYRLLARHLV